MYFFKGDSGSPVMLKVSKNSWVVVGIMSSFVIDENSALYVSVAGHLPWIKNIIDFELEHHRQELL